jgi:hypothetical protein
MSKKIAVVAGALLFSVILWWILHQGASLKPTPSAGGCIDNPQTHDPALVAVAGATNVMFQRCNGVDQVLYRVARTYPANDVVAEISTTLKNAGWKAQEMSFYHPTQYSSHVEGWYQIAEHKEGRDEISYQWKGEWLNKKGDMVWYVLHYEFRYPRKAPESILKMTKRAVVHNLQVVAAVMTAAMVAKAITMRASSSATAR